MAMVMYLFTCGFVCDNSNVYSTCNNHTDSEKNLNSRRLLCWRFTGGKIRRPSLWSKGTVSGSVLFSGRIGCIDQADDVLFLPLPPCCSTQSQSIQEARGKRFQSFTGQLQRHSTRQRRQSNHSFVTEYIETTASVSYHNSS